MNIDHIFLSGGGVGVEERRKKRERERKKESVQSNLFGRLSIFFLRAQEDKTLLGMI
jgi:hypothetical protein